jgi:N-methylhydantoinase A
LNVPVAILPQAPGCLSALGLLLADIEHEQGVTHRVAATAVDLPRMAAVLERLTEDCTAKMEADNVDPAGINTSRFAGMRYVGQSYQLEVEFPQGVLTPALAAAVIEEFHRVHERVYNHSSPKSPVEFVSLRVVQRFSLPRPRTEIGARTGLLQDALKGRRRALFAMDIGYVDVPVYDRYRLPLGQKLAGPAILEQEDTTSVIYPNHQLSVDPFGNIIIQVPIDARTRRSKEAKLAAVS